MNKIEIGKTGLSMLWKRVNRTKANPLTLRYMPSTNMSACVDTFTHTMPSELYSLIKDIKNPEIIKFFKQLSDKKIDAFQLEDVIRKLKMCEDEKVHNTILQLIKNSKGKSKEESVELINKVETILDSVNCAQGKYSPLYSIAYSKEFNETKSALEFMKQKKQELKIALENGDKQKCNEIQSSIYNFVYSSPRAYAKKYHKTGEDRIFPLTKKFIGLSRFDKIKELLTYYPKEKELGKYLWKKYFIPYIKSSEYGTDRNAKECIKLIKEIEKEFGTIVFYDTKYNRSALEELKSLKRELITWKIAGKKYVQHQSDIKYPTIVDLTNFKAHLSLNVVGYCQNQTQIVLKSAQPNIIRHEMTHLVDKKIVNGNEALIEVDIPKNYVSEMEKHVEQKYLIPYARKGNWNEWKAVSVGNADARNFSPEYRQELENKGLPNHALNLMSHDEAFENILRKKYGQEYFEVIEEIKESLNGNLPSYISEELIKHPQYLERAKQIIKNKNFESGWDFLTQLKN